MIFISGPTTRQAKRIKIKVLWKAGHRQGDISRQVGMCRQTVGTWIEKFKEADAKHVDEAVVVLDKPRPGAQPKITAAVKKMILDFCENQRTRSLRKTAQHLKSKNINLHWTTIGKFLAREGLYPFHRPKQLRLTAAHKRRRVTFAKNHKNHPWNNTLFTDETEFPLYPTKVNTKNDVVWARNIGSVPPAEVDTYSPKLKVWGGVSAKGKTKLIFYDGNLSAKKYQNEILKAAKPEFKRIFGASRRWWYYHDGASAHKAATTNKWLKDNVPNHFTSGPKGVVPAKSADLNIVEHVWGYMDGELLDNPPKTLLALKRRLNKIWREMDLKMIVKMADGMKKRLLTVVRTKGEWTE